MDRIKLKDEVIGARDLDVKYEEIFLPERLAGAKRPSPLGVTKSRHLTLQGSELTRSHSAFIKIVWNLPSNIKRCVYKHTISHTYDTQIRNNNLCTTKRVATYRNRARYPLLGTGCLAITPTVHLADVSYLGFRLLGATCPWPMGAIMSRLSALPGGCALIALKVKTYLLLII
ncbi:hypothetical protein SFRURICE_010367 [Spodoptera frugiperda]|nr:hypothetical protein SFRURICE_010367 [Spodoptera frugiperda]